MIGDDPRKKDGSTMIVMHNGLGANNSFKPNLLRGGKGMAEKLAIPLPPLRKSA